jgi:hypothetical protein
MFSATRTITSVTMSLAALLVAATLPSTAAAGQTAAVIPAQTEIAVRTKEPIDSQGASLAREYAAALDDPLTVGGAEVAPKNTSAVIRITEVQQAGAVQGRASLTLELVGVMINGQRVPLTTAKVTSASGSQAAKAGKSAAIGCAAGGIIGGILGGGKTAAQGCGAVGGIAVGVAALSGQRVQVAKEQRLTFTVADDAPVGAPIQVAGPTTAVPVRQAAPVPITVAIADGVRYELASAIANGNTLTITVFATNQGIDRELDLGANDTPVLLIDDMGNSFRPADVTIGNQRNRSVVVNGVNTSITLTYQAMPTIAGRMQSSQVRRLTLIPALRQGSERWRYGKVEFQFMPIQKN